MIDGTDPGHSQAEGVAVAQIAPKELHAQLSQKAHVALSDQGTDLFSSMDELLSDVAA